MMDTTMYTIIGVCVASALLSTLYFWLEHNAKNDLSIKENPVKVKWIIGGLLGGMTVAGVMCYNLQGFAGNPVDAVCAYGLVAGLISVLMAKVYNEGISAVAKWLVQKTKDVKEAEASLGDILGFMQEQKAEMEEIKTRLGVSKP